MDDMAKSNANPAEYYQYSTDDLVKGKLNVPHFAEKSWLAFPVLRGAYKYVQVHFIVMRMFANDLYGNSGMEYFYRARGWSKIAISVIIYDRYVYYSDGSTVH